MAARAEWGKGGYTLARGEVLREHLRTCWPEALIFIFFVGLVVACTLPAGYVPEPDAGVITLLAATGMVVTVIASVIRWPWTVRRTIQRKSEQDPAATCVLKASREGILLGYDQCAVWFSGGLMHVRGLRISFELAGTDIDWEKLASPTMRNLAKYYICLSNQHGNVVLSLTNLNVFKSGTVLDSDEWFYLEKSRLMSTTPVSAVESLPPTNVDTGTLRGLRASYHAPELSGAASLLPVFLWNIVRDEFSPSVGRIGFFLAYPACILVLILITRRSIQRVQRARERWNQEDAAPPLLTSEPQA